MAKERLKSKPQQGQTMIFIVSVLALLMLMCLWLFDFNTATTKRIRAQNGADSAAVSAAQWQAKSLNAIGEINLIKGINMLLDNVPPGAEVQSRLVPGDLVASYMAVQECLDELQVRLTFVGPIVAMVAAQQAGKNGGIETNEKFTSDMREQADYVELYYSSFFSASGWGTPDWAPKYARMLHYLADDGIAVAEDNAVFYWGGNITASAEARRYLLSKTFYNAIAIKDWCYLRDLLVGTNPYSGWNYWGSLTVNPRQIYGSEYFNLGVRLSGASTMGSAEVINYFDTELAKRGLSRLPDPPPVNPLFPIAWPPPISWATYIQGTDAAEWDEWNEMQSLVSSGSMVADIRTQYHFKGADARTAVAIKTDPLLPLKDRDPGYSSWIVGEGAQQQFETSVKRFTNIDVQIEATASAKPFGQLPGIDTPAYTFEVVLPVYNEVRLVPNRSVISTGSRDRAWLMHINRCLPQYCSAGPVGLPGDDFWDAMLVRWEDPDFRQEGIDWLNAVDSRGRPVHDCTPAPRRRGGGGGGGGGSGAGGF
jgi:hypothetical protein